MRQAARVDDNKFVFEHCPECGGNIERGGIFSSMGMVFTGHNGRRRDCGKEWHVIWENSETWQEEDAYA